MRKSIITSFIIGLLAMGFASAATLYRSATRLPHDDCFGYAICK